MTQLRLAWSLLIFAGGLAIYLDLAHRPLAGLTTVPLVATLGAALITIAITSIVGVGERTGTAAGAASRQ